MTRVDVTMIASIYIYRYIHKINASNVTCVPVRYTTNHQLLSVDVLLVRGLALSDEPCKLPPMLVEDAY